MVNDDVLFSFRLRLFSLAGELGNVRAACRITLDTYSHVLPGLQAAAAEALDTILAEPVAEAR